MNVRLVMVQPCYRVLFTEPQYVVCSSLQAAPSCAKSFPCYSVVSRWRWVFPGRWLSPVKPVFDSSLLRNTAAALLNLVFPEECRVCGTYLRNFNRIPVCRTCLDSPQAFIAEAFCTSCHAPFLNEAALDDQGRCALCRTGLLGFDAAFAYGDYSGTLRELIHLFKYEGVQSLASPLGALAARALPRSEQFDVIVPMPLHWRKRMQRGFNQSSLIARELSRRTGVPAIAALRRVKRTDAQAGLTGAQRRKNVAGAFAVRRPEQVAGKHVLLVDDVLTTGATAGVCAAVLKRKGARRVSVVTVARADRRLGFSSKMLT